MSNAAETYSLLENDPFVWLEEARGAQMSAEVILTAWKQIRGISQTQGDMRERNLAYMKSFMLLTAVAFENVIKGIFVAKKMDWRTLTQKHDGGHGMSAYAEQATTLSSEESELLLRLQEYLVWASRYVIPKKEGRYVNNHQMQLLRNEDLSLISTLFTRLAGELSTHARANSSHE